ncbi:MAG: glutamate-5-semialdehyde dehydrogenase [Candidatus Omnitrophica bacterium]|nr:glutamate-5-semialdehyde dehydrogenase [Candidatus Omnitrophota bacterium]
MLAEAKNAFCIAAQFSSGLKQKMLRDASREIVKQSSFLIHENQKDIRFAQKEGLTDAIIDRLTLTQDRIRDMARGVEEVSKLPDPIGCVLAKWKRPNGLMISKVSVPLGVILIIYESRPNVTVECAALCIKSGNAVILRGGREAFHSNQALIRVFKKVLARHRAPLGFVNIVPTTDRHAVDYLLHRNQDIQLVIPRGGESLIRKVAHISKIPVIKHFQGICHVYVDKKADLKKAVAIAHNAKLQRPGVCNAMETLLVHRDIASRFLPAIGNRLRRDGCEIRGDQTTLKYLPWARLAKSGDFGHEFLDKILAVKVVQTLEDALQHIRTYGSAHTDAIVTEDHRTAKIFCGRVDSSSVMVNASTRFSDGFQYGFGAEIGISTDKIHARGPMGLEGLTSYKYIVEGSGQVRI